MLIGSCTALLYPLDRFQKEHKSRVPYEQNLRLIPIVLMFILLFLHLDVTKILRIVGNVAFDLTVAAVILMSLHPKVGNWNFIPFQTINRHWS